MAAMETSASPPQRPSLDERLAFWSSLDDRRPEECTDEELETLKDFRAALLEAEGLQEVPQDWTATYYSQCGLLRFLRAKGTVEAAVPCMQKTLDWARTTYMESLRMHEEQTSAWHKRLLLQYSPEGLFGHDRRGMPVSYLRMGLKDTAGLMREVGAEAYQRFYMDKICIDSYLNNFANVEVGGEAWMGSVFVVDMEGLTWARGMASLEFLKWLANNVLTDHFPEVTRVTFVVNAPWFFSLGWTALTPFVPYRTREKIRIFGAGSDFWEELGDFLEKEQAPLFLGGQKAGWPYGDGGDVPEGLGSAEPPEAEGASERKESKGKAEFLEVAAQPNWDAEKAAQLLLRWRCPHRQKEEGPKTPMAAACDAFSLELAALTFLAYLLQSLLRAGAAPSAVFLLLVVAVSAQLMRPRRECWVADAATPQWTSPLPEPGEGEREPSARGEEEELPLQEKEDSG